MSVKEVMGTLKHAGKGRYVFTPNKGRATTKLNAALPTGKSSRTRVSVLDVSDDQSG